MARQWWRPQLPEVGKKTSPGRLAAMEELGEHAEAVSRTKHARGPLFIALPSRFTASVYKFACEPPYCAAGRRGGGWSAPGAIDESSTIHGGELARCGGRGGAAHGGGGCGRGHAAKRVLVAALWGARGGRGGFGVQKETWRAGCGWPRARTGAGRDAAARCTRVQHVQNARSGRAQSTPTRCSAKCQCMLQGLGEAGT